MEYSEMSVQQRAEYLLAQGVIAKLDIDPEAMEPGYAAHVIGVGKLPCGYHASEEAAIAAGLAWLREKATTPNRVTDAAKSVSDGVLGDFVGQWIGVDYALPDSDTTVVINVSDSSEPVWLGFYDGECWRNVEGFPVTVAAWAEMPEPIQLQPVQAVA